MRRAPELLLLAAAAACFALAAALAPGTPPAFQMDGPRADLRVATWNVGGSGPESGSRLGRSMADKHLAHVLDVLDELDADLVFLQEIRAGEQIDWLRAECAKRGRGFAWARSRHGRRVCAVSRAPELRTVAGAPPHALLVEFEVGERAVRALGVHASATSSAERNELVGRAVDALLEDTSADLLLLAGDLNLDLDLGKRRDLFTDDEYLDVETYNYVAERLVDAARGAGATAEPDRRLDYLFVGGAEVRAAGPIAGRRVDDMDHDPVVADLRLGG